MFAPICREIFTLSFEIMAILDWTSPLKCMIYMFYKLQYLCSDTRKIRYPKYLETFSYTIEMSIPTQHVPVTIFIWIILNSC